MSESKATTNVENEQADRFGPARSVGNMILTYKQGVKAREIKDEQSEEENSEEENSEIQEKFNA